MSESYPAKIKAVGINETGGVEVIQNLEVPFPEIKPTDLLIKVLCYIVVIRLVIALRFHTLLSLRSNGQGSTLSMFIPGTY